MAGVPDEPPPAGQTDAQPPSVSGLASLVRRRPVAVVVVTAFAAVVAAVVTVGVMVGLSPSVRSPVVAPSSTAPAGHPTSSWYPLSTGFQVLVRLRQDVTQEQKRAVESALSALRPVDGVLFESREQAYERFKEQFKNAPDLLRNTRLEDMQESLRVNVTAIDCATVDRLRHLPGVDMVTFAQVVSGRPTPPSGPLASCWMTGPGTITTVS